MDSSELHPLVGTDITIGNLQAKPEYNGLCARCERWYPEKERYVVKIPFTGKILLLKPSCVLASELDAYAEGFAVSTLPTEKPTNKTKSYVIKEEEIFEAAAGYIRKNADVRRILSQRVKEGYKSKGPGALILNVYDVHSAHPRIIQDHSARDILTNPEQTTWMSSKELEQKLGRAWTHGCGDIYELPTEWPEMCKPYSSAAFSQILNFQNWKEYCQSHHDEEGDRGKQEFYERWGLCQTRDMFPALAGHVARRSAGEKLPLVPENEREHLIMPYLQQRDAYDNMCSILSEAPLPAAAMIAGYKAHKIEPIGKDTSIWQDKYRVDPSATGFYLLSFKLVPFAVQNHPQQALPNLITGTGWMVLGFESVTFWFPYMADLLEHAKSDEEAMLMFAKPNTEKTDLTEAGLSYQGGSFYKNLPSSVTATEYRCSNPHCQVGEMKVTQHAKGETQKTGSELSRCSRCRKVYYCRKECQVADWPRHKEECIRQKKSN